MNRTATRALVGCVWATAANAGASGWLLMGPEMMDGQLRTDAPVSERHQVAGFDTARECMQEKLSREGVFWDRAEDTESAAWTMALEVVEASRCVPAEYGYGRKARSGAVAAAGRSRSRAGRAPW